jgi:4-amino-4-deoxy-L-arabinose transferase-like glycosyltransferase
VGARLALLPWSPEPLPRIHDEFCYLLAGDTFASGRLTNPAHPLWEFFETFHVIHLPTYSSKYPPGQGLLLAAGLRLAGHPWFGVAASYAFMLAAFWWAFRGWLPDRWATVAGVLALVRFPVYHYWLNSYWGGTLAGVGGALLVGAAGRMRRRLNARAGLAAGAGLALLSLTRPFEGLVLAAALALLAARTLRVRRSQWIALAPGLAVVAAVLAWQACYNHAVTGNALKFPHLVNDAQYSRESNFYLVPSQEGLSYRHEALRSFYQEAVPLTPQRLLFQSLQILELVRFSPRPENFVQVAFGWAGLLAMPFAFHRRTGRFTAVWLVLALAPLLVARWYLEHYGAPAASLRILVLVLGVRSAAAWLRRPWVAGFAVRAGLAVVLLQTSLFAVYSVAGWRREAAFPLDRAALADRLSRQPGKHLVIVRYDVNHSPHDEWVYNAADIDSSKVVWARDMGDSANRRLLGYFPDRKSWLLEPDRNPRDLQPVLRSQPDRGR